MIGTLKAMKLSHNQKMGPQNRIEEVLVHHAHDRCKNGAILIDVRTPEETDLGKPEGCQCIPLDELPQRVSELNPEDEIYVICRSGHRSGIATQFLQSQGFQKVANVQGGYLEWVRHRLPSG